MAPGSRLQGMQWLTKPTDYSQARAQTKTPRTSRGVFFNLGSGCYSHVARSEHVDRVVDEHTDFVTANVVVARLFRHTQDRATQLHAQVFGRAALDHVLDLVEELTLVAASEDSTGAVDAGDVVATDVSHVVGQARNAKGGEVQTVAHLPGTLVGSVEVRPVGVRQVDGVAAIANATLILLVTTVRVAQQAGAGAALVCDGERVSTQGVGGRQAPDLVVTTLSTLVRCIATVQLGTVAVEVQGQGLVRRDREHVVQVHVLLLQHFVDVGSVQGCLELIGELVATTQDVDAFQATAVTTFGALARFGGEVTGV